MSLFDLIVRKGWLISMAVFLLLGACIPSRAAACPPLKVGVMYTADDAAGKDELDAGYQAALKEINGKGIAGGCKVELVYPKNQKSTTADAAQDVQDLVDQGALTILSAQTNDASKRTAEVSGYLTIPVIIPVDTGDEVSIGKDSRWFVRMNPANSAYAAAAIGYLKTVQMPSAPRLAILFEQTEYGESSAADAGKAALAESISIGMYHRYSPFLTDFKEISDLLAKTDPNANVIYLISTQPKQAVQLLKELSKAKTAAGNPMSFDYVIGLGSAFTSQEFLAEISGPLNSLPPNLVVAASWTADAAWKDVSLCDQVALPSSGPGGLTDPVLRNIQGYASLNLAVNAIEQVTKKNSWKVNDKTTVTDWKELLRNSEYVPLFRSSVLDALRATRTCQLGSQLWPVNFNPAGQNQRPGLLTYLKDGKWSLLAGK